jgi:hypothetical protein
MVHVKKSGLIMKRRGVLQEVFPGFSAREWGWNILRPAALFLFAFDPGWSFL